MLAPLMAPSRLRSMFFSCARGTVAPWMLALSLAGCGGSSAGESNADACSNGRDDDGDGLADCADPACGVYAFCLGGPDAGRADAGPGDAGLLDGDVPDASVCAQPVDLVLSVDVSSSMADELALLRDGSEGIFAALRGLDPGVQVALVVFVDDALAVDGCRPFTSPEALAESLEGWRLRAPENLSPAGRVLNQDCPENGLDALSLAAVCPFRDGSARVVLHVTDDTYAEHPTVLSGPFGGGVLVEHTYAQTRDALLAARAHVVSLTSQGMGAPCGAGRSPDVGQGFATPYLGQTTLPERTAGRALLLDGLRDGTADLVSALRETAARACR